MRFASIFAHLPHTLLVSSLVFAANALPVESVELLVLTPENFKDTIAQGLWFIEHFSPYCGHCRKFAPTWEQLVDDYGSQADPGIRLAQVNCAVHGDLCKENNVDGYPQMNLYRDGQFVDTYKKARDFDLLTAYLDEYIEPKETVEPEPTLSSSTPDLPIATLDTKELIAATFKLPEEKTYNPGGNVVILNEKSFTETIADGHVFVKFYAPWCGHCKKLAPLWTELARNMRGKLTVAEVNCEEQGSLCRDQGVTGYPMLFYYPNGRATKMEYTGGRRLEQLVAFSERLSGPPVLPLNEGELSQVVAEHSVVYLLLRSLTDKQSLQHVVDGSHVLFGTPPIYISSSPDLFKQFNVDPSASVLLALKDHEEEFPAATYRFPSRQKALETWLVRNKLPTIVELHTDTFQEIMNAPHHPLVVLVAITRSEVSDEVPKLTAIANQWKHSRTDENVVFAWMDAEKWASWLKSMYGVKQTSPPSIVIVDHSKLVYWDSDPHGSKIALNAHSITTAISGASRGTIAYKHSENIVERFARYLNNKMVTVEKFVSNRPWTVVLIILGAVVGLYFLLRRLLQDDIPMDGGQYRRLDGKGKTSRLD
ncbi:hypothetical protein EUX98_g2007 [Antrodiella citrinella]|uniref:Thioredoxin domain-containing protein n=1 Tax=Antrodiella citrinella TaxID=2447956 RepID=A0A4V3XJ88_9APHY|nr:hypothetical protein EUX98_g2007 [Antrodiella citrinella]